MRVCPSCGADEREELIRLSAEQFCSVNWTYSKQYSELLRLEQGSRFPIDICVKCHFVYAHHLPSGGFLKTLYEEVIDPEKCRQGSENVGSYARRMRYLSVALRLLREKSLPRVLDYGCGMGATMKLLQASGVAVIGFDPSAVRAQSVEDIGLTLARDEADLRALSPFDLIICDNVLEHVPYPKVKLDLLAVLMRPGGFLYVSVPDLGVNSIRRQRKAAEQGMPVSMALNPWEHLNYFDHASLDALLDTAGFRRLRAARLPAAVDVGVRAETNFFRRVGNAAASMIRLGRYTFIGEAYQDPCHSFYVFSGSSRI